MKGAPSPHNLSNLCCLKPNTRTVLSRKVTILRFICGLEAKPFITASHPLYVHANRRVYIELYQRYCSQCMEIKSKSKDFENGMQSAGGQLLGVTFSVWVVVPGGWGGTARRHNVHLHKFYIQI